MRAKAFSLPEIEFQDIAVDGKKSVFGGGDSVFGYALISNDSEWYAPDLSLELELAGSDPFGNRVILGKAESGEIFGLSGREILKKDFSFPLPLNLPKGDAVLRFSVKNSLGKEITYKDLPAAIGGNGNFFYIDLGRTYDSAKEAAKNGAKISDGKNSSLIKLTVFNPRPQAADLKCRFVSSYSDTGEFIRQDVFAISLGANEKKTIDADISEIKDPGQYVAGISCAAASSGEVVSNLLSYRWVIGGEPSLADIYYVLRDRQSYQAGQTAKVDAGFYYAAAVNGKKEPSSDQAPVISATFFDSDGKPVCGGSEKIGVNDDEKTIAFPVPKDLKEPKTVVEITESGRILHRYVIAGAAKDQNIKPDPAAGNEVFANKNSMPAAALAALAVVLAAAAVLFFKKRGAANKKI